MGGTSYQVKGLKSATEYQFRVSLWQQDCRCRQQHFKDSDVPGKNKTESEKDGKVQGKAYLEQESKGGRL